MASETTKPRFSVKISDREHRHSVTLDAPTIHQINRMLAVLANALESGNGAPTYHDEERDNGPTTNA